MCNDFNENKLLLINIVNKKKTKILKINKKNKKKVQKRKCKSFKQQQFIHGCIVFC